MRMVEGTVSVVLGPIRVEHPYYLVQDSQQHRPGIDDNFDDSYTVEL